MKKILFIIICIILILFCFFKIYNQISIDKHNEECNLYEDIQYIPNESNKEIIRNEQTQDEIEIEIIPEEQLEAEIVDPSQYDPVPSTVYTNTDVNMRNMPSMDGDIEDILSLNTELTKVGTNGDWTIVAGQDNRNHFVHSSCISTEKTEKEIRIASRHAEVRSEEQKGGSLGTYVLTAYCGCAKCCGKSNGITASGTHAAARKNNCRTF